MPVSVTEVREQARLLEAELSRQAASSESSDTRAGVLVGLVAVLVGLLVQVKHPNGILRTAEVFALLAALVSLAAAFPRRLVSLDPTVVTDLYERYPEAQATWNVSRGRLEAVVQNYSIVESKRLLLSGGVAIFVVAAVLSAVAVG